jgi:3D (Asp-Asp-Asp) domain-containing protein
VRLEDGQEVSRQTESEWVATEPQDQVLGYGTQIVVKSMDTPDGSIEYYRAVNMYATSYSPCQQGLGRCSLSTSSGTLLKKGVVAVTLTWYRMFKGAQVYIPGYGVGTIGDVGGGIPGVYWIDLGYSEEDFESWSQTVTVYFLTPAPSSAPPILP